MKENVILGIDPGTNILGYGVIRVDSKGPHYEDMGIFDLRKINDPFEKLANIYAGVSELLETVKPDSLAVESPFYGKNAQVILKLGRAQGAAITAGSCHTRDTSGRICSAKGQDCYMRQRSGFQGAGQHDDSEDSQG